MWQHSKILARIFTILGITMLGISMSAKWCWEESTSLQKAVVQFPNQRSNLLQRWLHIKSALMAKKTRSQSRSTTHIKPLQNLYLGLSTLRDDLDFTLVREKHPNSLSLSGSGGNFRALYYILTPILTDPDLHAHHIILTAHSLWLSDWDPQVDMTDIWYQQGWSAVLQPRFWKDWLVSNLWLMRRKHAISYRLDELLQLIRQWLSPPLPLHPDQSFKQIPWSKSPSRLSQSSSLNHQHIKQMKDRQWQRWTAMGKFRASSLLDRQENKKAFKNLIDKLSEHTKHLTILLLPETHRLRTTLSAVELTAMQRWLTHDQVVFYPNLKIEWCDARDWIDDTGFYDYVHLNKQGRQHFTHKLQNYLYNTNSN
jgi:hypothetical protein